MPNNISPNKKPANSQPNPQTKTPQDPDPIVSKKKKPGKGLIIGLITLLFLAIGAGIYLIWDKGTQQPDENIAVEVEEQTESLNNTVETKENIVPNNSINKAPYQKEYLSHRLGVKFSYLKKDGQEKLVIKEVDNKVYLVSEEYLDNLSSGQYVEVFQKDPEISLMQALEERFLKNYSEKNCGTVDLSSSGYKDDYPESYEVANIEVLGQFDDVKGLLKKLENCPSPYTQSNGVSYFLMDKNHPEKFAFFSIGQYAIMADDDTTWQKTFRFVD